MEKSYPAINLLLESSRNSHPQIIQKAKQIQARDLLAEIKSLEEQLAQIYIKDPEARQLFDAMRDLLVIEKVNRMKCTQRTEIDA